MAKAYLGNLAQLVTDLKLDADTRIELECRQFFSGAALDANNVICAFWTPAGRAFKLSQTEVTRLFASGEAKPLRYFAKVRIKKSYAVFENPEQEK